MASIFDCVGDCTLCLPSDNSTHVDDSATPSRRRWEQEREAEYGHSFASSGHSSGQRRPPRLFRSDTGQDTCGSSDSGFCGGDYNYYYNSHSNMFDTSANRYRPPTPPRERRTSRRQSGRAAAAAAAAAPRSLSSPPCVRPTSSSRRHNHRDDDDDDRARITVAVAEVTSEAEAAAGAMKLSSLSPVGGIKRSAARPHFAGFFADSQGRAGGDDRGAESVSPAASIEAGVAAAAAAGAAAAAATMAMAAPSPSDGPQEDARQATAAEIVESIASLLSARPMTAVRAAMQARIDGELRRRHRSPLAATAGYRSDRRAPGTDRPEHSGDSTRTMAVAVATPVAVPSGGTYGGDQLDSGGGGGDQEEENDRAAARRAATAAAAFVASRNGFSSSGDGSDSSVSRGQEEMASTGQEDEEHCRAVQALAIDVARSLSWTTGAAAAAAAASPVLELPVLRTQARRPSQSSYGGSANEDGTGSQRDSTDLVYLSEVSDSDLSAILTVSLSGMPFHDAVFGSGDQNVVGGDDVEDCSPGGKVWAATTFPRENTEVAEDARVAAAAFEKEGEEEEEKVDPAVLSSGTSTDTNGSVDHQPRGDEVSPVDSGGSGTTWRRDGDVLIRNRDMKDRASVNVIEAIASGAKCLETAPCKRDTDDDGANNNQGLDLGQDRGSNGSGSPAKT
ncbi:unnamed protein product [Ectocarpus sp. 4 AP-2014]